MTALIETMADIRAVLGRARYRRFRREAFALLDAKAAIVIEHGPELSPEARRLAHIEISNPALKDLIVRHMADASFAHWQAEDKGKYIRVETPDGDVLIVPRASISGEHRAWIAAARLRRRLARARQREARR